MCFLHRQPLEHDAPVTSGVVRRELNDGRQFDIMKMYYDPAELEQRLIALGWQGWVRSTSNFFLYGSMVPKTNNLSPD